MRAIARLLTGRPWFVLFCSLLFVIDAVLIGGGLAERLRGEGLADPVSESAQAEEILEEHFPATQANFAVLVEAEREVNDRGIARQGVSLVQRLAAEPSVISVNSFWTNGVADLRSDDGRHALVLVQIDGPPEDAREVFDRISPAYRGVQGDLLLRVGGELAVQAEMESTIGEDLVRAEMIALPIVFLLLVIVFGSAVAALLPLLVGIVSIIGTNAVLAVIAGFTDVSVFAQNLTTALGLGLAIDYALLLVRRHRDELAKGHSSAEAISRTLRTAGRTVLYSALIIGVALSSLAVFPQYFLRSFAYAGIPVVVLAAVSAIVVLPACLALLGQRIDALDVRRLFRRGTPGPAGTGEAVGRWSRSAQVVMRRAPAFTVGSVLVLLALGLPFLSVEFGTADHRQLPAGAEARAVSEILDAEFDDAVTGTINVAVERASDEELSGYAAELSGISGIEEVRTPVGRFEGGERTEQPTIINSVQRDGDVSYLALVPTPQVADISPESIEIVRAVHDIETSFPALVAGPVATLVDSQDAIAERLPVAVAAIALVTLVVLFLLTGGLLVSVVAIGSNALSLVAMYGLVVWVFQQGNLSDVLGFEPTGYIDTFLPVLMFCVTFGLSMDYGVFLLARIKEEYERTGDHRGAVAAGLQRTGGIITAAALILAVVLVAVGMSRITNSMMLGWGAAVAVLVDATVVRCLLMPAVLGLLGERVWWAPAPMRRFQRRFGLSESIEDGPEPSVPDPVGDRPLVAAGAPTERIEENR